jgi:phosphate transport system permease protein
MIRRRTVDSISAALMRFAVIFANALAFLIGIVLVVKACPILAQKSPLQLLFGSTWHPLRGQFGLLPFLVGTVAVTLVAMVLSIPVCLLSAIYLSEYARQRVRSLVMPIVDVLAGIPSVVYGLWGVIVIVPLVRSVGQSLGSDTTGYSLLAGGLVLSVMVVPVIVSVSTEVMRAVPVELRESTIALGATRWETARYVVLRAAHRGIFAAIILGFARAFGETLAVLMVVGNVARIPVSVFDPVYPLPALIANNYGEMMSLPLYDSALMLAALILLVVAACFIVGARLTLRRLGRTA